MKYDFVNPVLEAASEVLSQELQTTIEIGRPSISSSSQHNSEVMVMIGLTGGVEGQIMLGLSMLTVLNMIGVMIGEMPDEFDDMVQSGIAEMGNVIAGRASNKLTMAGFNCDITPPMTLVAPDGKINTLSIQRLVVPLTFAYGDMMVHVALRPSKAHERPVPTLHVASA